MIVMIDNYDSFTFNIVQYLGELGEDVDVYRNDQIDIEQIQSLAPSAIVISPGPCTPNEAGISMDVVIEFAGQVPILGVCLGHQSIGQVYGGDIVKARQVMHGMTSLITLRCSTTVTGCIRIWVTKARINMNQKPDGLMLLNWGDRQIPTRSSLVICTAALTENHRRGYTSITMALDGLP